MLLAIEIVCAMFVSAILGFCTGCFIGAARIREALENKIRMKDVDEVFAGCIPEDGFYFISYHTFMPNIVRRYKKGDNVFGIGIRSIGGPIPEPGDIKI
jgi:hypothetical protein